MQAEDAETFVCEENKIFIWRAKENHWTSVTWSTNRTWISNTKFNILQSSVETQGIARWREAVEAEPYLYPQMVERGHGMYYTPPIFSQYPFEGHQNDTSASEHSLGGVAETYPNFSWPTMISSQQYDAPIPTPNVLGAIPDMDEVLLLGVDLRH